MDRPSLLFISHGSLDLVLHESMVRDCVEKSGERFAKPRGVIVALSHFETKVASLVCDRNPDAVYDFRPIDEGLNKVFYSAPGAPVRVCEAAKFSHEAGIECDLLTKRGYDHGTWVPLSVLYKNADIPIVQLLVQSKRSPYDHIAMGKALQPLVVAEILVIRSGSITHNLSEFFGLNGRQYQRDNFELEWATAFAEWVADKADKMDEAASVDYFDEVPCDRENTPTPEQSLLLFVAFGAVKQARGGRPYRSTQFSILAQDASVFH